jgi:peptidoglycan/LPS O-acetylase OafA/YrhL
MARLSFSDRHVPALDGIRGLAVLAVILVHAQIIWRVEGPGGWLRSIAELGQHGVVLFFVLSGFLITGILDDSRDSRHYFRNFYARRALRIFPLYYLFLVIAFFVQPHVVHKPDVAAQYRTWFWLYGSNFLIGRIGFLPTSPVNLNVTWSLAIEEQFYIVWPLVVLLFRGIALRRICLWIVCGSTLFRLCTELLHLNLVTIYVLTPSRLDALALGAWTALALRDAKCMTGFWIRNRGPIGIAAIAAAAISFVAASRFPDARAIQTIAWSAGLLALSISFSALLVHVSLARPAGLLVRVLSLEPLRLYGKVSYFVYLFHWSILRSCALAIRPDDVPAASRFGAFSGMVFIAAALVAPLVPAWCSWHIFEKQFLKLKRFFPSGD